MEMTVEAIQAALSRWNHYLRPIVYLILAGLAVRFALAFYSAHAGDQFQFAAIALGQVYGSGPYANPNIYPPGWDLILGGLGRIVSYAVPPSGILFPTTINIALQGAIGFWEPTYMVSPVFVFSEKLLFILFDLAAGLLLYQLALVSRIPQMSPKLVFSLWFLNPLVIWESSVHGDFDVLPTFFALLAMLFVLRGRPMWTGVSLGLSIILKLFALFLIPIALVLLLRRKDQGNLRGRSVLGLSALFALGLAIPIAGVFWSPGVLQQYDVYSFTGPSIGEGYGGFWVWSFTYLSNFQFVGGWLTAHTSTVTEISFAVGGILAVALATVPFWSRRFPGYNLLGDSALFLTAICTSFFADAVVQPQYLIWIVPFMAIWASMKRTLLALLLVISTLAVA